MDNIIFNYDFFIDWYKANQNYEDIFEPGLLNGNLIRYYSFSQGNRDLIQNPKKFVYLSEKYGDKLFQLNPNLPTRQYNRLNNIFISIVGSKIYFVFPREDISKNSEGHQRIWGTIIRF